MDGGMDKKRVTVTRSNRLLGAFETASRRRIEPHLELVECKLGDVVCEAGGILNHAYSPMAPSSHC
jgi:hypothetical protein